MKMRQPAYALATILVLLGVCLFGAGALVTIGSLEARISKSQQEGVSAYYAAEAGVSDALWRLNSTPSALSGLRLGTLSVSYSATNAPLPGQGFSVEMASTSAGIGTITVNATSNNGDFISKRQVVVNIFAGPSEANIGTSALFSGFNMTISAASARNIAVTGTIFSNNNAVFSRINASVNGSVLAVRNVTNANSSISTVNGTIHDLTRPAAPTPLAAPGFDFMGYKTNVITPANFVALLKSGTTVNIPGPITYVDGNVSLSQNDLRNRTINLTGMLIINGNLSIPSNVGSSSFVKFIDPGTGKVGLFVSGNIAISGASWNVQGVVYASGNNTISAPTALTVNGALIAGGNVTLDPGPSCSLTFNSTRVTNSFHTENTNGPAGVVVQHWEEEY